MSTKQQFWDDGTPKSTNNSFNWRNQDRSDLERWMTHLQYVKRGMENASKKFNKNTGLVKAESILFKMNIIAFSRAKEKNT